MLVTYVFKNFCLTLSHMHEKILFLNILIYKLFNHNYFLLKIINYITLYIYTYIYDVTFFIYPRKICVDVNVRMITN